MSDSITASASARRPTSAPGASRLWPLDLAIAAGLVFALSALTPALLDGDGLDYASAALYPAAASPTEMKHPLYVPVLISVHRALNAAGLTDQSLKAFCLVSHLAAAGLYLTLARGLYPRFLSGEFLPRFAALGVVASYGVLSRAVTVEVYVPALLADVLLVLACLTLNLERRSTPPLLALLILLAASMHIANLALLPGIVAIVVVRLGPRRAVPPLLKIALVGLASIPLVIALLQVRRGLPPWPLDPTPILPRLDPEPPLTLTGRLARAAYGFARSIIDLPGRDDLSPARLAVPATAAGLAVLFFAHLARHARIDRVAATRLLLPLAALVVPVASLGIRYYPSDVERWIFLTPAVWLLAGLALDHYVPPQRRPILTRRAALGTAAAALPLLALHNAQPLLAEARSSRALDGLRQLAAEARPGDLVISPAGVAGRILTHYLPSLPPFKNLTLYDLARESASPEAVSATLQTRVGNHLAAGGRVLVYGLFDEPLEAGVGFPWSYMPPKLGPEFFVDALGQLDRVALAPPSRQAVGLFELIRPKQPTPPDPTP